MGLIHALIRYHLYFVIAMCGSGRYMCRWISYRYCGGSCVSKCSNCSHVLVSSVDVFAITWIFSLPCHDSMILWYMLWLMSLQVVSLYCGFHAYTHSLQTCAFSTVWLQSFHCFTYVCGSVFALQHSVCISV